VKRIKKIISDLFILPGCFIIVISYMIICSPRVAFAAASITLSSGGVWDLSAGLTQTKVSLNSPNTWTVTGSTDGSEDIYARVSSTSSWKGRTAIGITDEFVLTRKDALGGIDVIIPTDDVGNGNMIKSTLMANTTYTFGLQFQAPSASSIGGPHILTVTLIATNWVSSTWVCGKGLAVMHVSTGGVAPETKGIVYKTTLTNLAGPSNCWITQNLGATRRATSATDNTEDAAGWYWQFNRKQGYKHDGGTLAPEWPSGSINENNPPEPAWKPANDPCTILLGTGWRIPTSSEWGNAKINGGPWGNATDTFNSVLRLHSAGYILPGTGALTDRSTYGYYWSSSQNEPTDGRPLWISNTGCYIDSGLKAHGFSVRCLKDE